VTNEKFYTDREEKANYITHGLGVLISIAATVILLNKAISSGNRGAIIAYGLFGIGMTICMGSSTIYHYVRDQVLKARLRHFDHASIYLLIAASYSPFTIILLRDAQFWGWLLFGIAWTTAIAGIALSFRKLSKNSHLKTASYVMMGLVALIAFKPSIEIAHAKNCMDVIYWLLGGGLFYIAGAVIYATARREFVHAVFHLFVLLGLACHITAAYLIPL